MGLAPNRSALAAKRAVSQTFRFIAAHRTLWYSLAVLAYGLLTLLGYLTHSRVLIEIIPSPHVHITFATAFCVTLAACALTLVVWRPDLDHAAHLLVVLMLVVASMALAENVFGVRLGIDLSHVHMWVGDQVARPGRTSLSAALGLIGFAASFLLSRGTPSRRRARAVRLLIGCLIALSILGILGNLLDLDFLYGWHGLSPLALPTAVALLALGLGLREEYRHKGWYQAASSRAHADQLTFDADVFLIAVAISTSLVAFSVIQSRIEHLISEDLREQLVDRANYFSATLSQVEERTAIVASRPGIIGLYRRLAEQPGDGAARDSLSELARSFMPHGFTALRFIDPNGKTLASIGTFRAKPELSVPVLGADPEQLLWDDGFYLRAERPIIAEGKRLGSIDSEQPMTNLSRLTSTASGWGETSEVAFCAALAGQISCFPTRFEPQPYTLPSALEGQTRSVALAIGGALGVKKSVGRNNTPVLVAYRPLGTTGLGIIAKIDLAEIYQPIRSGFQVILPLLILLVSAGAMLLRRRMRPVLAQIEASQRAVVESENRFRVASESGLDAFLILESVRSSDGSIVDFLFSYVNRHAEKLLGLPREQILNQSLSNAVPMLLTGGWFERYKKVVDSGRPSDTEHSVEFPNFPATWVHQHIVPLGDGVAATVKDISELKKLEQDLQRMAQSDALTQLPNRALFLDRLEQAMIRTVGAQDLLAVLALDIDRFQDLNKQHGHSSGDTVLKEFARRLSEGVRPEDTVARTGGDEFGVILEGLDGRSQAFSAAEAILASLREEIRLTSGSVRMTACIGIALYSGGKSTGASLIQRADAALVEVKRRGSDSYFAAEEAQPYSMHDQAFGRNSI